jgi:ABC-type antimicrobial peptide transport system permease subunit
VAGAVAGALLAFPLDKFTLASDGPSSVTAVSVSAAFMVIIAIGLLAVAGPARRVVRVDSTEALRQG